MTALNTRSGFVALIGAPNAGKSTLINQVVGAKVSIVTHKVQTTRALVRGIAIQNQTQIVFVDTPGIFAPKRRLDRAMVTTAWSGAKDADQVLFLVDAASGFTGDAKKILDRLADIKMPVSLVLNKIDRVAPERLLELTKEATDKAQFAEVFMVSALNGNGCDAIMKHLETILPESPVVLS